ncbi:MAG: 4-(cytidine 5'-diphospho)-2-C-methyl-D-erythritol kinase, partial [Gemmatimonadaceae bacterium]|nr:4-(cytidine 5'-diphospho)-2-C-methyl-D-erythritol kinase [Gemmatimonadaceae bacterium]
MRVTAQPNTRTLRCDGPTMPAAGLGAPEHNLAWRAAQAFVDAARWDTGWDIDITKNIPVGGGLGGGSADAAAVLRALNTLCPTPLPLSALCEIGGTLGADVPFLVAGVSRAWGWGRGDRLLVLPALP